MKQYLDGLDILLNGREGYRVVFRGDRTGTGTYGFFGHQLRFDLSEGFPLLTAKSTNFRALINELVWFLRGQTNIKQLHAAIWNEWAVTVKTVYKKLVDEAGLEKGDVSGDIISKHIGDPAGWAEMDEMYLEGALIELAREGFINRNDLDTAMNAIGELGPVYGAMWRNWMDVRIVRGYDAVEKAGEEGYEFFVERVGDSVVMRKGIDQIANVLKDLKENPYSRRHIVSGWNPAILPDASMSPDRNALDGKQALPPCHTLFQFFVEPMDVHDRINELDPNDEAWERYEKAVVEKDDKIFEELNRYLDAWEVPDKRLSCQLYQRSADYFLGVPFNIASYAALTHLFAHLCGYTVGDFIHTFGDIHLYSNHVEQAKELLSRAGETPALPKLRIDSKLTSLDDLQAEHFILKDYNPMPPIAAPISV